MGIYKTELDLFNKRQQNNYKLDNKIWVSLHPLEHGYGKRYCCNIKKKAGDELCRAREQQGLASLEKMHNFFLLPGSAHNFKIWFLKFPVPDLKVMKY